MKKSWSSWALLLLLGLGFIGNVCGAAAAAPSIEWQKSLGGSGHDEAYSIQQTTDGGYIVAGFSESKDGDVSDHHGYGGYLSRDYWIVKLNATGNIVWQKSLGGSDWDEAHSIQQTADGGYIVAGFSESDDGDVSDHQSYRDYWVVKLNSTGGIVWQKSLNSGAAYSIQQTTDGGYIVAGDSGIIKLNADGNITWQTSYDLGVLIGGDRSIQQTSDGGYIVASASIDNGGNYLIIKLNATGNVVWQKSLGGSALDAAASIQQTSDGGYIVAGISASNDGDVSGNHGGEYIYGDVVANFDYWVVKLNATGDIVWQKSLGGSGIEEAHSIQQTSDGGYIVAGTSSSYLNDGDVSGNHGALDYWIVKLNATGSIVWQKSLGCGGGADSRAYSVQQTSDGGYIIAGYSSGNEDDVSGNHGGEDYWIVKLGSDGSGRGGSGGGGGGCNVSYGLFVLVVSGFALISKRKSR
ncbi:lipoprotein [Synergistales bacterium]|nr:lipoprotein [Synergistales bacterium]